MPSCRYCGASFPDEDAYLDHLREAHRDELGRIDRRRVDSLDETDRTVPPLTLAVIGVALLVIVVGIAVFLVGGNDVPEPTYDPSVHVHGTMEITIDGEDLPLSEDPAFVTNDEIFHFHGYEMDRYGVHIWHIHGTGVTLQWALETLGVHVDEEGTTLTYDGVTYEEDEVDIRVNGEPVHPGSYELDGVGPESDAAAGAGDDVVIVVDSTD